MKSDIDVSISHNVLLLGVNSAGDLSMKFATELKRAFGPSDRSADAVRVAFGLLCDVADPEVVGDDT